MPHTGFFGSHRLFFQNLKLPMSPGGAGLSVRRGFGGHHISYFIFQNHISKKKKNTRVYGQKPIPSFRPRTLAGHLPSYVDMSGKFSGKCRAKTHQNGSGHIHGGDRYLKNGIESRVQNLSIAARYDQTFASGVQKQFTYGFPYVPHVERNL